MIDKIFKKLYAAFVYLMVFVLTFSVFAIPTYIKAEREINILSSKEIIENIRNMEMNLTSIIYVKGEEDNWVEYQRIHGDENRIWVGLSKIPKNLKNAFIAIEDETFYTHHGINWRRTFGAIANFIFKFDDSEFGGSTITQQLIKNITSDNDRAAARKVREIIRALLVEKELDKDMILEAYLNTIALGNGINGVQVAANYYFNKDVSELSLSECASLAAITQNPSKYNPITKLEANTERRNTVLEKMFELKMVKNADFVEAITSETVLDTAQRENYEAEINDYFVDTLIEEVIEDLARVNNCTTKTASTMLYNGGYKIYATVDPRIQNIMEEVYTNTDKYFRFKGKDLEGNQIGVQSAMTIVDYEGHIVGIMGGAGEKTENRGLNRATDSPRQPGSTMKPLGVYTLAIENDIVQYASKVLDEPIKNYYETGKSGPREWYGEYKGGMPVNYAIRKSANAPPVRLLQEVGIENSYKFLTEKLRLKHLTEVDKNLSSLALGGCQYGITTTESASAFAIFGNDGYYHEPTTYYKVVNSDNETVLEYDDKGERVISSATATIMNHLLREVVYGEEGTGGGIAGYSSMRAYAKTGTSSESRDLWMVAGTPYYVGSVWYGFDIQQEIHSTSAAATVWREIMRKVHSGLKRKTFTDSEDVYQRDGFYFKKGIAPDIFVMSKESSTAEETSEASTVLSSGSEVTSSAVPSDAGPSGTTTESSAPSTTTSENTTTEVPSVSSSEAPSVPTPPVESVEPTVSAVLPTENSVPTASSEALNSSMVADVTPTVSVETTESVPLPESTVSVESTVITQ